MVGRLIDFLLMFFGFKNDYRLLINGGLLALALLLPLASRAQKLASLSADTLLARLRRPGLSDTVRVNYLISYGLRQRVINRPLALRYMQQAQRLARQRHLPRQLGTTLRLLGGFEMETGQLPAAQRHLEESLQLYTALHDQDGLAQCYNDLGNVAASLTDYPRALRYYQQALRHNPERTPTEQEHANILRYNLAGVYSELHQPRPAMQLLRRVVAQCQRLHIYNLLPGALASLGTFQLAAGQPDSARRRFRQGLAQLPPANRLGGALLHTGLAQVALVTGPPAEALREAQLALRQARQLEDVTLQADALQVVAGALRQLHRPEAYDSLHRYLALHDTIARQERAEAVLTAQARFDNREQQAQILALQQERRLAAQTQELTRFRTQRERAGLGGAATVLLLGAGTLFGRYRRRQAAARALAETTLRRRIAAELHDDVGSLLTQVSMESELLRLGLTPAADQPAQLRRMATSSRDAVRQMADVVWGLGQLDHAATLGPLLDRMRDHADLMLPPASLELMFETDAALPALPVPAAVQQTLYLIYKEALHNAVKYAQGTTTVTASLCHEGRSLTLRIADNGRALTAAPVARPGHGLANMAARAEAVGGTVTYAAGDGFAVLAHVPLG